jgi:ceramide glucosyltransferase
MFCALIATQSTAAVQFLLEHLLWYVAILGSVTSTIFLGLAIVAVRRYVARARVERRQYISVPREKLPPVTVLKPVHGLEPRLEETLESFFRQDYPDYEIIFGARSRSDASLEVIAALAAKYPGVSARVVISGDPSWPNAKVFSLAKMIGSSDNQFFVISDSDILVGPDFLRNVVPPLLDEKVGLVTCLYRGVPDSDPWSHLEALGMSVEMPTGVMVAGMMDGMKFALGAAMAVRRDAIDAIGGMGETAQFYSDDFVLGNLIAAAGYEVVLSHYPVEHVLQRRTLRRTLGDQLRWMKSTRFSRPWGHVGSGLTYAVPFGLLALALALVTGKHVELGVGLLALAWFNRVALAVITGWGVLGDRRCLWLSWLYPLRDLLGFGTWAASFVGSKFFWRGEPYRFGEKGRIMPVRRSIEFVRDGVPQAHD